MLKSDEFAGLYRGVSVSLFSLFAFGGFGFAVDDVRQQLTLERKGLEVTSPVIFFPLAVTMVMALSHVLQTICVRMLMRSCERQRYPSALSCAREVVRPEGVRALFNGFGLALARAVIKTLLISKMGIIYLRSRGKDHGGNARVHNFSLCVHACLSGWRVKEPAQRAVPSQTFLRDICVWQIQLQTLQYLYTLT